MKRVHYTAAEVEALVLGALAGVSPEVTMPPDEVTTAPAKRWVDSWWALPVAGLLWFGFLAIITTYAMRHGAREHVEAGK